jgi:flavin reductase (DIM6/NTAB) family NADH-FMN oxidoreductase RutF
MIDMVDLKWEDPRASKFVTSVGLITTRGATGDNIMSSEWTHHISYSPGFIAVCINKTNPATAKNIEESEEFTVNLASVEQSVIASISGNDHGNEVDKIALLKEIGFKFSPAKKVKTLVLEGSSLVAECKLMETIDVGGSHTIFIGEIVEIYPENKHESLVYYKRKFWHADKQIAKPDQEVLGQLKQRFKRKD